MKNNTKVLYDLSIKDELTKYKQILGYMSPELEVKLHKDLSITVKYKGKKLKSTLLGGGEVNDTLILNRNSHRGILLTDLEKIGTIYQVESRPLNIDLINFHLEPSLSTMNIETILYLDNDVDERDKVIKAIKAHPIVKIIDDGKSSDEVFAAIEKQVDEVKSHFDDSLDFDVTASQYGPIWIEFEIKKPKTIGKLIDKVVKIRHEVYSEK